MEIEKLRGVVHNARLDFITRSTHINLKPSRELLEEIRLLPPKSRVAIEEIPPDERTSLESLVIDGVKTIMA